MSTNTLIVGAVLLSFGLGVPQEAPQAESEWQQELQHQSEMEFKRQQELQQKQEMEFKLQQITEKQAIGIRVPLEAKVVKDAPYSAEFLSESVQLLPDGNRIVRRSTGRVYRDSEGRGQETAELEDRDCRRQAGDQANRGDSFQ